MTIPSLLWLVIFLLIIFWLLGFVGHVGGDLIHLLLVLACILIVYNVVTGRVR